ncbi:MAG: HIT domain-containing protein [Cytophagales bacterium]|nr:HIT domain-containing protein [Cytophagales bacterium]
MDNHYNSLLKFITDKRKMRMQHISQPVMLMTLLRNGGKAPITQIAKEFLSRDESQIDYYAHITKAMPTKVLKGHGIVDRDKDDISLVNYGDLSESEIQSLIDACQHRLDDYLDSHGQSAFDHRKKSSGYISGTLRYEILKKAKFRCELCGISADEKALEVDHILPRNKGGGDDSSNLQALCYSCNAMKRDRDDTDLRNIRDSYSHRETGCLFCEIPEERIIAENELAYAIRDGYPVTGLHTLVIPKRHVSSYFDLGRPEINACNMLLESIKQDIQATDTNVTGFNIGINDGEDAGQTIFHCHIHLIPRRKGDVEEPRGGIRGVIPDKQKY